MKRDKNDIETRAVIRDFPDIAKDVAEAHRDYKTGKWKKYTSLDKLLEKYASKRDVPGARFVSHKKAWGS